MHSDREVIEVMRRDVDSHLFLFVICFVHLRERGKSIVCPSFNELCTSVTHMYPKRLQCSNVSWYLCTLCRYLSMYLQSISIY